LSLLLSHRDSGAVAFLFAGSKSKTH